MLRHGSGETNAPVVNQSYGPVRVTWLFTSRLIGSEEVRRFRNAHVMIVWGLKLVFLHICRHKEAAIEFIDSLGEKRRSF